jgi:hypothetical protein
MILGEFLFLCEMLLPPTKMLIPTSVNCRLPQTPRTPSVGMAHYFDEVLTRVSTNTNTPRTPGPRRPIRRSSTHRYETGIDGIPADSVLLNGENVSNIRHHLPREEGANSDEAPYSAGGRRSSFQSVGSNDPRRQQEREEHDSYMRNYITQQLEHLRTEQSANGYRSGDEFETHA